MDRKGSVLITAAWILTLLAFLTVALAVRMRLDTKMMGIQLQEQDQRELLSSGVEIARYLIESDKHPEEDGPQDAWFGTHSLTQWIPADGYDLTIGDEDGKLNLNRVSPQLLKSFFDVLEGRGITFSQSSENMASNITRWRGERPNFGTPSTYHQKGQPYESLEELLLVENMTYADFEKMSKFLTVYGRQGEQSVRININTASDEVIEAIIRSLAGDDFAKKEFTAAFIASRKGSDGRAARYWRLKDLSADKLMSELRLSNSVLMISVVNQFLQFAGVDSSYFNVTVQKTDTLYRPGQVTAVVGPSGGRAVPFTSSQATIQGQAFFRTDHLQVLSWHEGL